MAPTSPKENAPIAKKEPKAQSCKEPIMFFVVDKPRMQRIISIVRDDKRASEQGENAPFLRLKAVGDELTISGRTVSGTFPTTVYEQGVLFLRTTVFRRLVRSVRGEKFLAFQVTQEGLRFGDVLMPFEGSDMVLYPDADTAPESWPPPPPEAEQIPEKKEPTLFDLDDDAIHPKDSRPKNSRGA